MIDFFVNVVFGFVLGVVGRSFLFVISLGKIKIKWHDAFDPLCSLLGMVVLLVAILGIAKISSVIW